MAGNLAPPMIFEALRTLCLSVLGAAALTDVRAAPAPHPRLILTPSRVDALKAARNTTHRELWERAWQCAETLAAARPPAMADAGNRYRTFGDTLPALGLAYRLSGEQRFIDAADRWLQALLAVPSWRGSQNLGRSAWVVGAALTYDWLHDVLPAATRSQVRARLAAEGEILLRETSYWRLLSNHCLIETTALGMIGLTLQGEDERAGVFLDKARERADLIIEHAPADGSWGEGVQYWQYGLGYFLRYLEASKTAGHHDYYPRYEWLQRTGLFPIHFSLPGAPAEMVNFSDSGQNDYVASFLLYLPAAAYRNGRWQDYGNRTRNSLPYKFSWMDFIAYDPTVQPEDFTALPTFHHFTDNGFVTMRSGWSAGDTLVAFHCGPGPGHRNQADPRRLERRGFGPGHGHPDANSFCLFARGQWLVLDPGYVRQKWTRDENTILVNGRGQAGEGEVWLDYMAFQNREPAPRILRAETHPDFDYVIGDAGNVYVNEAGLGHFRRHLLFLKPDTLVVLDDVGLRTAGRVDWRLHAYEAISRAAPGEFEMRREGVRLAVRALRPANQEAQIETRPLRASETSGTVVTLNLAAHVARRGQFLVVLSVLPEGTAVAPEIQFTNGRLSVARPGGSWSIGVLDPAANDPAAPLLIVNPR